jgi:L-2-hydroxyglutarate oxidase LhgO
MGANQLVRKFSKEDELKYIAYYSWLQVVEELKAAGAEIRTNTAVTGIKTLEDGILLA